MKRSHLPSFFSYVSSKLIAPKPEISLYCDLYTAFRVWGFERIPGAQLGRGDQRTHIADDDKAFGTRGRLTGFTTSMQLDVLLNKHSSDCTERIKNNPIMQM